MLAYVTAKGTKTYARMSVCLWTLLAITCSPMLGLCALIIWCVLVCPIEFLCSLVNVLDAEESRS